MFQFRLFSANLQNIRLYSVAGVIPDTRLEGGKICKAFTGLPEYYFSLVLLIPFFPSALFLSLFSLPFGGVPGKVLRKHQGRPLLACTWRQADEEGKNSQPFEGYVQEEQTGITFASVSNFRIPPTRFSTRDQKEKAVYTGQTNTLITLVKRNVALKSRYCCC